MPKPPPKYPIFYCSELISHSNSEYAHAFKAAAMLSNKKLHLIYRAFRGNLKLAYLNNDSKLSAILGKEQSPLFFNKRAKIDTKKIWQSLSSQAISTAMFYAPEFPKRLAQIPDPPFSIYYRGALPDPGLLPIAIVGTRKCTDYGKRAIEYIISGLAGLPVLIISGMAFGADAHAHRTALEYGIKTAAVLGSSVDNYSIYPRSHRGLAKMILESGGALISEFPPPTQPHKMHFPMRNRIIAGMSEVTIVAEAAEKSGALITAEFALDQGHDVYAVPGSIFNTYSSGPNQLISEGALPLNNIRSFIEKYLGTAAKREIQTSLPILSATEQAVIDNLKSEPIPFSRIQSLTRLNPGAINAAITNLELKDLIISLPGNFYRTHSRRFDKQK